MTNLFIIQNYMFSLLALTLVVMTCVSLHPIILMIILIYWNIILIFNMSLYKSMFIYPIMFFIIMISGLLISLLYFASMISNEKSSMNFPFTPYSSTLMFIISILLISIIIYTLKSNSNIILNMPHQLFLSSLQNNDHLPMIKNIAPSLINLNFMYSHPLNNLTTISILYLLISLMTIIKICSPKNMSMRKLN